MEEDKPTNASTYRRPEADDTPRAGWYIDKGGKRASIWFSPRHSDMAITAMVNPRPYVLQYKTPEDFLKEWTKE